MPELENVGDLVLAVPRETHVVQGGQFGTVGNDEVGLVTVGFEATDGRVGGGGGGGEIGFVVGCAVSCGVVGYLKNSDGTGFVHWTERGLRRGHVEIVR